MHTIKRKRLPTTRESTTHEFTINNKHFILTIGLKHKQPFEMFLKGIDNTDSTIKGFCRAVSILASLALQYDCPPQILIEKMCYQDFEPCGMTNNDKIPMVKSIIDYVGRWMASEFQEPIPEPPPIEKVTL